MICSIQDGFGMSDKLWRVLKACFIGKTSRMWRFLNAISWNRSFAKLWMIADLSRMQDGRCGHDAILHPRMAASFLAAGWHDVHWRLRRLFYTFFIKVALIRFRALSVSSNKSIGHIAVSAVVIILTSYVLLENNVTLFYESSGSSSSACNESDRIIRPFFFLLPFSYKPLHDYFLSL